MSLTFTAIRPLAAAPHRALAVWVGAAVFVALVIAGNRLLNDPDTYWQIAVGQWIVDHRSVPIADVYSFTMTDQPWISTQWLAQVLFAQAFSIAGWSGPVVLAAATAALAFGLLAHVLETHLPARAVLVVIAVAFALTTPHLSARPHALALPVMVAWFVGLVEAMDRRGHPSFWLLPLMTLWANLHGGFVLGLALIAPVALDVVVNCESEVRPRLVRSWIGFGTAALLAACITPYGWESLLAARRILSLGAALNLIGEWRPANFARPGALELVVLGAGAAALWCGVRLPAIRALMIVGLVLMALGHVRNAEILALLAPLVVAAPLARQFGVTSEFATRPTQHLAGATIAVCAAAMIAIFFVARTTYAPDSTNAPQIAVAKIKSIGAKRVLNDYDFGGYLISQGVAPFIDGRTELYGEQFMLAYTRATELQPPTALDQLLRQWNIDATLLRSESPAALQLDRMEGWAKVYSDKVATMHVREAVSTERR